VSGLEKKAGSLSSATEIHQIELHRHQIDTSVATGLTAVRMGAGRRQERGWTLAASPGIRARGAPVVSSGREGGALAVGGQRRGRVLLPWSCPRRRQPSTPAASEQRRGKKEKGIRLPPQMARPLPRGSALGGIHRRRASRRSAPHECGAAGRRGLVPPHGAPPAPLPFSPSHATAAWTGSSSLLLMAARWRPWQWEMAPSPTAEEARRRHWAATDECKCFCRASVGAGGTRGEWKTLYTQGKCQFASPKWLVLLDSV
jgi:hypothetical protein